MESQNIAKNIVPGMSTLLFAVLQALAAWLFMLVYGMLGMRLSQKEHEIALDHVQ